MIYIIVLLFLLFSIFHFDIKGKTNYRDFCFCLLLLSLVLISGLRYRLGVDTTRYITRFYHETPLLWKLSLEDLSFGTDPLYTILNSIVLSVGGHFYVVQLIHATFVNTLLFKYIKRHSQYIFTCVFFYFIWQYCALNMEEMRASMSVVICLFANDYMIEKKWVKGIILYLIGCLFHVSTIIIVMLSLLLFFFRFNIFGVSFLILSFVVAGFLRPIFEDYLTMLALGDLVDDKVNGYLNNDEMMERGLNIRGYLVKLFMYSYSIIPLYFVKKRSPDSPLAKLEPLLMIFLLFALIGMQITIAYRFVRFYFIYFVFFISHLTISLANYDNRVSRSVAQFRAVLVILPLVFLMVLSRIDKETFPRYHPYASVIEKGIDKKRELLYSSFNGDHMIHDEY